MRCLNCIIRQYYDQSTVCSFVSDKALLGVPCGAGRDLQFRLNVTKVDSNSASCLVSQSLYPDFIEEDYCNPFSLSQFDPRWRSSKHCWQVQLGICTPSISHCSPLPFSKPPYSGGTILSTLLNPKNDLLEHCNLSLLVRGEDKARVFDAKGLKTVLFDDLENTQEIERIASNYDCAEFAV